MDGPENFEVDNEEHSAYNRRTDSSGTAESVEGSSTNPVRTSRGSALCRPPLNDPPLLPALEHKACSNRQGPSSTQIRCLNIKERRMTRRWDRRTRYRPSRSLRRRDARMRRETAPKLVKTDIRGSMVEVVALETS